MTINDDGSIQLISHSNASGYCSHDGEEWPCSAADSTDSGYAVAKEYAAAQRSGSAWDDSRPRGLQSFGQFPQ